MSLASSRRVAEDRDNEMARRYCRSSVAAPSRASGDVAQVVKRQHAEICGLADEIWNARTPSALPR
jgi:hypothetical protein